MKKIFLKLQRECRRHRKHYVYKSLFAGTPYYAIEESNVIYMYCVLWEFSGLKQSVSLHFCAHCLTILKKRNVFSYLTIQ